MFCIDWKGEEFLESFCSLVVQGKHLCVKEVPVKRNIYKECIKTDISGRFSELGFSDYEVEVVWKWSLGPHLWKNEGWRIEEREK